MSASVRAGRQCGVDSLVMFKTLILRIEENENDPWELGWVRLNFKGKNMFFPYFRCMKGKSPSIRFAECKQMQG